MKVTNRDYWLYKCVWDFFRSFFELLSVFLCCENFYSSFLMAISIAELYLDRLLQGYSDAWNS